MTQNIKKDYFWNSLGVFAQNAISPVLLIVITRINGIDDAGLFSFTLSLAIIFWAFSIWGARTYQVSDVEHKYKAQSYVMVRLLLSGLVLLAAVVFALINQYDFEKTALILILVVYKIVESVADAVFGILQIHGKLYLTGRSLVYKAVLGFGVFVGIEVITKDLLLASAGFALAYLLVLFVFDIPRARKLDVVWSTKHLSYHVTTAIEIIRRCAPIASVIFMSMFALLIPRYFVDLFHPEEIGYFGILAMPITAFILLITFIIQPNVVRLSQLFAQKSFQEYRKIINRIIVVIALISLLALPVVYFIGPALLHLIFGLDFENYRTLLILFVFGAVINAFVTIYINLLTIMRHFRIQFYTLLLTNVLLVIACLIVVPMFGLFGSIVLYFSVNVVQLVFLVLAYQKALRDESRAITT